MTILKMKRMEYNNTEYCKYYKKLRLRGVCVSGAVALPPQSVDEIAIHQTGNADIYLTNYHLDSVRNGTAQWQLYDGISPINKGVTAIYCNNASGNSNVMITAIRGSN